jgi:uncharacterized protein (DUF58 family)
MWKQFMSSIGLLAVALMAALYSSSAGREGRVLATAFSAVIALGIAIWVAVKFVPRLAAHVDWEWLPFFSHYHVTREGWIYFGSITIVVFAAINTANNLLYMVLSAMLAVLALSGFLSALNFRLVRVSVRLPARCYAGEPFPFTVQVQNQKRMFPTFSIFLEPSTDHAFRFSTFYIPLLRGLQVVSQTGQAMLSKRGRYMLREVKTASWYPFGFFMKDRNYPVDAQCLCYPEILPADQVNVRSIDLRGTTQRFERGLGHDLYMIRDYIPSDTARNVHWKASAKTSTLKTREYAAEETERVTIVFDRFGHPGDIERFERLVSHAASAAYHLTNSGLEVKFVTNDWEAEDLESILEYLALVEMSSSVPAPRTTESGVLLTLRTPLN